MSHTAAHTISTIHAHTFETPTVKILAMYGWDYSTPGVLIHNEKNLTILDRDQIENIKCECLLRHSEESIHTVEAAAVEDSYSNVNIIFYAFIFFAIFILVSKCAS